VIVNDSLNPAMGTFTFFSIYFLFKMKSTETASLY
jgi:hypothetical protein